MELARVCMPFRWCHVSTPGQGPSSAGRLPLHSCLYIKCLCAPPWPACPSHCLLGTRPPGLSALAHPPMSVQVDVTHLDSQSYRAEGNLGNTLVTQFLFSNIVSFPQTINCHVLILRNIKTTEKGNNLWFNYPSSVFLFRFLWGEMVYTHINICEYMCIYVCKCICVHIYLYIHSHTFTHVLRFITLRLYCKSTFPHYMHDGNEFPCVRKHPPKPQF